MKIAVIGGLSRFAGGDSPLVEAERTAPDHRGRDRQSGVDSRGGGNGNPGRGFERVVAIGLFSHLEETVHHCVRMTRRYEPDLKNRSVYDEMFGLYRQTYKTMWELWDHHQRVVESRLIPMETR